ncbi:MAG: hypothetical protein JST92_27615, partial [Deltaproteobacteria bacterium]|nr:hypothetical protein [Deltaproteobacteria bacterium]
MTRSLIITLALSSALACTQNPRAWAGKVTSHDQLIGGARAIGELGDFRLSNNRVRFIVQGLESHPGFKGSRAVGTFGGALIDADLTRSDETSDVRTNLNGHDNLGELFPAFFLSALEPTSIAVIADGSDGRAAHLRVEGDPSEFITATQFVDKIVLRPGLHFVLDYVLEPADDFLKITASIENPGAGSIPFPISQFPIPIGFICLFGQD